LGPPAHSCPTGIGWRFALVGILNAIFVHVWVTRHYIVAFIFALLLASSISTAYYSLTAHYGPKSIGDTLFVHLPFSLWHAWSIVLVIISAFSLFTQCVLFSPGLPASHPMAPAEGFLKRRSFAR